MRTSYDTQLYTMSVDQSVAHMVPAHEHTHFEEESVVQVIITSECVALCVYCITTVYIHTQLESCFRGVLYI